MKLLPALCLLLSAFASCDDASAPDKEPACSTAFSTVQQSTRYALDDAHTVAYTDAERQRLPPYRYATHYLPTLQSAYFDMSEYNIRAKRDYHYHIHLNKDAEKIWLECSNPSALEDAHGGNYWGDLYYIAYKVVFADSSSFFSMHPIGQPAMVSPIYMIINGGIKSQKALIAPANYDRNSVPAMYNLQAPQGLYQKMLGNPVTRIDVYHYETAEDRAEHKDGTEVLKTALKISAKDAQLLQQYLNCVKDMPVPEK